MPSPSPDIQQTVALPWRVHQVRFPAVDFIAREQGEKGKRVITANEALPDGRPDRESDDRLDQQPWCRVLQWRVWKEKDVVSSDKLVDCAWSTSRIAEGSSGRVVHESEEGIDGP